MTVLPLLVVSSLTLSFVPRSRRLVAIVVLATACAASAIDSPVSHMIATAVGVPGILSVALLADLALQRGFDRRLLTDRGRRALLASLAVLALALYPSALGLVAGNAYRAGFSPIAPVLLAVAGMLFVFRRELDVAIVLAIALVALDLEVLPSLNAFDYVVDPIGGAAGIIWATAAMVRRIRAPRADLAAQTS